MLVSFDARLAYIAMTKCASTAIETALRPHCEIVYSRKPGLTHMTVRRYREHVVPYLRSTGAPEIETCCQMRHPVDWLGSWYRYLSGPGHAGDELSTAGESFAGFAAGYLEGTNAARRRFGRPWDTVRGIDGKLAVDHVYRYEDMPRFLGFLQDRLGRPLEVERINVSPEGDLALPRALRARLESFFALELEIFESQTR